MNDTHVAQVGGKHYTAREVEGQEALLALHGLPSLQHWDVMERFDVSYLDGTGTKYLMRWRDKGTPETDLGKAASYFEKALKCRPGQGARRLVPEEIVEAMCRAGGCHYRDTEVIKMVLCSGSRDDLAEALRRVQEMRSLG